MIFRTIIALFVAAAVIAGQGAAAQEANSLSVVFADGTETSLTLDDLDAMDQVSFATNTIWTNAANRFSGVPLRVLLEKLGAEATALRMVALNDYWVEMPVADLEADVPIIATRMNGAPMSVRDKGPYWVMFPFDDHPDYRTETNFSRSIWQLHRIRLVK